MSEITLEDLKRALELIEVNPLPCHCKQNDGTSCGFCPKHGIFWLSKGQAEVIREVLK